jgi:hypothetical protein
MSLSDGIKSSLLMVAAAMLVIGIFVKATAVAAPIQHCDTYLAVHHVPISSQGGATDSNNSACCTQISCCVFPSEQPLILPNPPFNSPRPTVDCQRPLHLGAAIDPPPRRRSM